MRLNSGFWEVVARITRTMKAKIIVAFRMLSCTVPSASAQALPFHPYRKVGDKYYDLNPLYS